MEHYKKQQSCYYEDHPKPNELRITGAGKAHDLATKAGVILKEHPQEGVHISAVGNHINKAVTVVEVLKRKSQGLQQDTTIKYARVEDIWESELEGLDSMKVTRKIPALSVHLVETADCKTAESAASEQPPPPARPSSGRGRNKKCSSKPTGSSVNQDKSMEESGQAQASACPEVEGVAQLRLLESQSVKTAKGGEQKRKKRHSSFPEAEKLLLQQTEHSRTVANTQGEPHNITSS